MHCRVVRLSRLAQIAGPGPTSPSIFWAVAEREALSLQRGAAVHLPLALHRAAQGTRQQPIARPGTEATVPPDGQQYSRTGNPQREAALPISFVAGAAGRLLDSHSAWCCR